MSARLLLAIQNLGLATASVAGALGGSFASFGAARLFGALVSWPQHPVGSAVLARRYPDRRAFALAWHVAGGSIGTAVIPLAMSAAIAYEGWRFGLAMLAIPLGLGALAVSAWLRDPLPEEEQHAKVAPRIRLLELLRQRESAASLAAGTIAAGGRGLGTLTTYVPAYLKDGLHLSALAVGGIFTAMLVGSIGGPVGAGRLADRLGRRRLLVVVYILAAAAIIGFVEVGSEIGALVVMAVLVGILGYSESPLLQAVFSEAIPQSHHQSAFGWFFAISYGVGSLWTILLGYLIDSAGFKGAFLAMAASFVLAGGVLAWASPKTRARKRALDL